jgi:hypothetical protein
VYSTIGRIDCFHPVSVIFFWANDSDGDGDGDGDGDDDEDEKLKREMRQGGKKG